MRVELRLLLHPDVHVTVPLDRHENLSLVYSGISWDNFEVSYWTCEVSGSNVPPGVSGDAPRPGSSHVPMKAPEEEKHEAPMAHARGRAGHHRDCCGIPF